MVTLIRTHAFAQGQRRFLPQRMHLRDGREKSGCCDQQLEECLRDLSDKQRSSVDWSLHRRHTSSAAAHQCTGIVMQRIPAPAAEVWSVVRRFEAPQVYKRFIKNCVLRLGDGTSLGSVRDVTLVSGLPARCSTERLEILDDKQLVMGFRVLGGEHRLRNYASVTSLHQVTEAADDGKEQVATIAVESYVVDVPEGNTVDETCLFTNMVVRCNLQSLARMFHR